MQLTAQALAARLNGREYGSEITNDEAAEAKAAGLVVVFGYSDDNVELRGAIDEEVGAYEGVTLRVTPQGFLAQWPEGGFDREDDAADYFAKKAAGFKEIEAVWCPKATEADADPFASWAFKTAIPHATFDVVEEGGLFCRGIVFRLADTGPDFRDRVRAEREARFGEMCRLGEFILHNPVFLTLPEAERARLHKQHELMGKLCDVLADRIAAFPSVKG